MYKKIAPSKTYRLINTGALMLISTMSKKKEHDIAPIAWVCPQELEPPRLLICCDAGHRTYSNIKTTKKFIASIPHISQAATVEQCGSVSGRDADKFAKFAIKSITGKKTGCRVPLGVIGYLECRVKKAYNIEGTMVIVADVLAAAADPRGFRGGRLLAEKAGGKAIHHLGGSGFVTYTNKVY